MTTDSRNKTALRRCIFEILTQGRLELVPELVDPRFRLHHERNRDQDLFGHDGFGRWVGCVRQAVPDLQLAIERMIEEGDRLMAHVSGRGTHAGLMEGAGATGTALSFTATAFVRLADGKILEAWVIVDTLGILRQAGALPGPAGS